MFGPTLMEDIDVLATHYHWQYNEIMNMNIVKREYIASLVHVKMREHYNNS